MWNALVELGVDFAWIDWQQGGTQGGCAGEANNPTILLNHLRSTDNLRAGNALRGMILARWGGMGTHRYQVGFSGDVQELSWTDLAFQPYFSLTASNVGYGFWSHDLGLFRVACAGCGKKGGGGACVCLFSFGEGEIGWMRKNFVVFALNRKTGRIAAASACLFL